MGITISIKVSSETYLRDPLETELGRNIIKHGIDLMSDTGFQCFNFKQLAHSMKSTEASVYRYFENKHMLLVYMTSWYWEYLDYLLLINTKNVSDPVEKLNIAIRTIVEGASSEADNTVEYIDLKKLHRIIVEQSTKVTHSKKIMACEKNGLFANFENLNSHISSIVLACDPNCKYPAALATNIIKMAIDHTYYAEHLCALTEITNCMITKKDQIQEMILYFVRRILKID